MGPQGFGEFKCNLTFNLYACLCCFIRDRRQKEEKKKLAPENTYWSEHCSLKNRCHDLSFPSHTTHKQPVTSVMPRTEECYLPPRSGLSLELPQQQYPLIPPAIAYNSSAKGCDLRPNCHCILFPPTSQKCVRNSYDQCLQSQDSIQAQKMCKYIKYKDDVLG